MSDRFGISCELDAGKILYKEKIAEKALGIGHFEPLRHYAEVQLLMEPLPKGPGVIFDNNVPENSLEKNWQNLILSHLYEKVHKGVLTGAILTDTKITLVGGKGHLKHTEGGDFREAALRAVRQGLMRAGCILLEPYYKFRLEVPSSCVGRAMADLQARSAEFEVDSSNEDFTLIIGRAPVSKLHDYTKDVIGYTRGNGRLSCTSDGYEPCHNAEEIISAVGYDPEADLQNPSHSVFCANGAGFVVPWNEVDDYKHLNIEFKEDSSTPIIPRAAVISRKYSLSEEELEAIMLREFGPIRRKRYSEPKVISTDKKEKPKKKAAVSQKNMTIIDGYNLIYSWDSLKAVAEKSFEDARRELIELLENYSAFTKMHVTLVFDAYLVKGGRGSDFERGDYRVVYTKQDQTADAYIEKMMFELGPNYNIRVVTGDRLLQYSAIHSGIMRMTAKEFEAEVISVGNDIREFAEKLSQQRMNGTPVVTEKK